MKLSTVLEQDGGLMLHHAEYNMNKGVGQIHSEAIESMEEGADIAQDEFGIQGQEVVPGVWAGWSFGDAQIEDEADEDGPYQHTDLDGDLVIISNGQITIDHPVFQKVLAQIEKEAEDVMSDAQYDKADQDEYNRDIYAYHGVRQSDFM